MYMSAGKVRFTFPPRVVTTPLPPTIMPAIGSTFPIVTSSTDFNGCISIAPGAIGLLGFGTFCFLIGRKCLPQVLPHEYEARQTEIKHLKRQITKLERRLAQQGENPVTRLLGEGEDGRYHDMPEQEEAKEMKRIFQSQKKALETALEKVNTLSAHNEYVQGELQKAMTELAVVREEVRGARTYMSMEDEYSGAEVVKHLERLNAAIMQAAANMAERLDVEPTAAGDGSILDKSNEEIVQSAEDIIGGHLMKLLRSSRKQAILELAFQAAMAFYTQRIVSSWCFRGTKDEKLLQESYMSMRQDKLQGIFGRWRQLTRSHLRASKSAIERGLVPNLAEVLANIVFAAGHRENPSSIHQVIMTSFPDTLGEIIDLAKQLNCMIGEGVTSFDISITFVEPDTFYDPAQMVEADGLTTGSVREKVVCTTDLGLMGIKKTLDSIDTSVMLRAKVNLPSMLMGIEDT